MTILNPTKSKEYLVFVIQFFVLIIIGSVFYIYHYNLLAENRFKLSELKEAIITAEVESAELKNKFYGAINPAELKLLAVDYNLVLDKNPDYLNIRQWVSDSSY